MYFNHITVKFACAHYRILCYINNFLFGECKTPILKILTFKESTSGNTPKPQFPTNSMIKEFGSNETVLRTIIKERAKKKKILMYQVVS